MSRKTIAMIILSEGIGGAEAVVRQIARRLDKSRYECLVITNDEIGNYYREAGLTTLSVGALYERSRFPVVNKVAHEIKARLPGLARARVRAKAGCLLELLRAHHIQLLHSHLLPDSYLASLLAPEVVARVMTVHGGLGLDVEMRGLLSRKRVLAVMNQADFLTSACHYLLNLLHDNGVDLRDRSAVIDNGIDAERLPPGELAEDRGPADVLKMVFLGGARYVKGGDLLAQALHVVVNERQRTNVRLLVLRDIHHRSEMYRCLRAHRLLDHVDLIGYVRREGHLDYIQRSDLYVLPSRSEGVANTLMEAIGLGKAILATDVGGTSEVVSHGVNGYLCQPTPESIADGIEYFLKNPAQLREFSRKNVELRPRFFWPRIAAQYEDLYERLLSRR